MKLKNLKITKALRKLVMRFGLSISLLSTPMTLLSPITTYASESTMSDEEFERRLNKIAKRNGLSFYDEEVQELFNSIDRGYQGNLFISFLDSAETIQLVIDSSKETGEFCIEFYSITDEDLTKLPNNLKSFTLKNCNYVSDLSTIPYLCPELETISIQLCPLIKDFSFLLELPNLKYVEITESAYITPELIEALNQRGIKHNLTEKDLDNAKKVKEIYNSIIAPEMTDKEKIAAITIFIIEAFNYNENLTEISNQIPLTTILDESEGVCKALAYITTILLDMANIENYEIESPDHAWNIIHLDNNYYYLDTTNVANAYQVPESVIDMIKTSGEVQGYMSDITKKEGPMQEYNSNYTLIPDSLIEDIQKGLDEKSLINKYKDIIPEVDLKQLIIIITPILTCLTIAAIAIHAAKKKKETSNTKKK